MKSISFSPGPSELYYTVNDHMRMALNEGIPSISHRGTVFQKIFRSAVENLRNYFDLDSDMGIYFTGSATEIWERITQSVVDNHSHHLVMGSFGRKFFEAAGNWNKHATATFFENKDFLSIPDSADLIAITFNETSLGRAFPVDELRRIREAHPQALIALDIVSAAPGVSIPFNLVDMAYFSVQKGFGLPAGLGVWVTNERSLQRANEMANKYPENQGYHSLPTLHKFASKNQTPETPNVLGIYLLNKVTEDLQRRGSKIVHSETAFKAASLYGVLDHNPVLSAFETNKAYRSKSTIVIESGDRTQELKAYLSSNKLEAGGGYGPYNETHIRLANFPVHSKEQYLLICDLLENFS